MCNNFPRESPTCLRGRPLFGLLTRSSQFKPCATRPLSCLALPPKGHPSTQNRPTIFEMGLFNPVSLFVVVFVSFFLLRWCLCRRPFLTPSAQPFSCVNFFSFHLGPDNDPVSSTPESPKLLRNQRPHFLFFPRPTLLTPMDPFI